MSETGPAVPIGPAASITGAELPSDQVYQTTALGGPTAEIAVAATCAGAVGQIQANVVAFTGKAPPRRAFWQTVATSAGQAAGVILVPRGGPYSLAFRDSSSAVQWISTQRIFVGDNGISYGQSNANGWMTDRTTDEPSQPLARKQAGIGWSVLTSAKGETFQPDPPTVFAGRTHPARRQPGELYAVQGASMAHFARAFMAQTNSPFGLFPYAAAGTDTAYWAPGTGPGWLAMVGSAAAPGAFNKPPFTFDASFAIRYQGEQNATPARLADFVAALASECRAWWALTGRDASSFRFGIVTLGSNNGYAAKGYFGRVRAAALSFIDDPANGAFYAGNPIDFPLRDNRVHLHPSAYPVWSRRLALTAAIAVGCKVTGSTGAFTTGAGPRVTKITQAGHALRLAVGDMDGSTALVTGDGGTSGSNLAGFQVFDSVGAPVEIIRTAFDGAAIVLTLATSPSPPLTIDHQMADAPYGLPPEAARIPYGNNAIPGTRQGAPLWPFASLAF